MGVHILLLTQELVYEYAKIILGVMTSSPEPHGKVGKVDFFFVWYPERQVFEKLMKKVLI